MQPLYRKVLIALVSLLRVPVMACGAVASFSGGVRENLRLTRRGAILILFALVVGLTCGKAVWGQG